MSNCTVPNWNLRHQGQEQAEAKERINRSSHVQNQQIPSCLDPMSIYGVTELTWENGHPAMHGRGGISFPTATTKPTWEKTSDTLESIVHQATSCHKQNMKNIVQHDQNEENLALRTRVPLNGSSMEASGKWGESKGDVQMAPGLLKKKRRSESDQCGRYFCSSNIQDQESAEHSIYASASATFCGDHDTTIKAWPSSESLRSVKTKITDDLYALHDGSENRNEENQTKEETVRSQMTRSSHAAAIHNQSERRRRDKINQKMKALQKLVPNASKTDKASMLDEVIEYLKHLQAQLQMMMSVRSSISQMMMPLGMQQQLQMSLLTRMGMGVGLGMGMGMFDMNNMARSATHQPLPSLIHPATMTGATPTLPFVVPPAIPTRPTLQSDIGVNTNNSVPYNDTYSAFLAQQSMNMEFYNKMAALCRQQANQSQQTSGSSSQANHVQRK